MSTSQGVNVLRYGALFFGIFYGFSHQRAITASLSEHHEQRKYQSKEDIIKKAKAEYAKSRQPRQPGQSGDDVITNPDDKNFDLEKYLQSIEKS